MVSEKVTLCLIVMSGSCFDWPKTPPASPVRANINHINACKTIRLTTVSPTPISSVHPHHTHTHTSYLPLAHNGVIISGEPCCQVLQRGMWCCEEQKSQRRQGAPVLSTGPLYPFSGWPPAPGSPPFLKLKFHSFRHSLHPMMHVKYTTTRSDSRALKTQASAVMLFHH